MIILYTQNLAKQIGLGNRKIDLPEFANPDAYGMEMFFYTKEKRFYTFVTRSHDTQSLSMILRKKILKTSQLLSMSTLTIT
mgnify:CR=1 FL=1